MARLIATWFGCGYAPRAPGTAGSLAAIVIALPLAIFAHFPGWYFAVMAALLFPPAVWAAGVMARKLATEDPQCVVVDEVIGQWIALAGSYTVNWKTCLAAFVLFRLFDIWKPAPVRQLESLPGGWGINADDAMAGVYAAMILWAAARLGVWG